MKNEELIKLITEEVLKSRLNMSNSNDNTNGNVSRSNYPLGENIPEQINTPNGVKLSNITLEKLISGEIDGKDMRITKETLEKQAKVAESVNRDSFARNLKRAAELTVVPDERMLEIYNALRPYRSTKEELYSIASELETKYGCTVNANFIKEAADLYEERGRLKTS